MRRHCPVCGSGQREDAKFCGTCGTALRDNLQPLPDRVRAGEATGVTTSALAMFVVLVLLLAVGALVLVTGGLGGSSSGTRGPLGTHAFIAPPSEPTTDAAEPPVEDSEQPTDEPASEPATEPASSDGTVDVTLPATVPDRTDIAATLSMFYGGINSGDYQTAFDQFSAAGAGSSSVATFTDAEDSSQISDVTVVGAVETSAGDHATVDVDFTSHQLPAKGPDGSACDRWTLEYRMSRDSTGRWRIDGADGRDRITFQPC